MTTEMFGAPYGIIASNEEIRKNVLTGLNAQKTLGDIAQQPAELELKQAHARLYGAEARVKEEAIAAAKRERALGEEFAARRRLVEVKAQQGETATVADLPPSGRLARRSGADQLIEYADFLDSKGAPLSTTMKFREKIATIQQHEAAALNSQASQVKTQLETTEKLAGVLGQFAQGALAQPAQYSQIRMAAVQQGLPPELFPPEFNPRLMRQYVDSSIKTKDKIALDREELDSKAQRARDNASASASAVRARVLKQREKLLKEDVDNLYKDGGKYSPEAIASQKGLRETRAARRDALINKEFPPVPLDPKARSFNKTYTAADGKTRFVWQKDSATGQGVARVLSPVAVARSVPLANESAKAAAKPEEEDDE